jgi:hypothetical protein
VGEETKLNPLALDALRNHQRQLDEEGVEVGVSRQALDELFAAYDELARLFRTTASTISATEMRDRLLAGLRRPPAPTSGVTEAMIADIFDKSDDQIMGEALVEMLGHEGPTFTRNEVLLVMRNSFEQGKAHMKMVHQAAMSAARPAVDEGVVRSLITTAKMLHANAVGCAQEHHSHDFAEQGMPGWLADAQHDIDAALATLGGHNADGEE